MCVSTLLKHSVDLHGTRRFLITCRERATMPGMHDCFGNVADHVNSRGKILALARENVGAEQ